MSNRFLVTKIPLADNDAAEKFETLHGRPPDDDELGLSYGETIIDLLEVSAIREAYGKSELLPEEGVVYLFGEPYYVQTPYVEVKKQWLAAVDPDSVQEEKKPDLGRSVHVLASALREDPELYYGYQSNIAMAFYDAWMKRVEKIDSTFLPKDATVHEVANQAAKNFLDQLIKSIE